MAKLLVKQAKSPVDVPATLCGECQNGQCVTLNDGAPIGCRLTDGWRASDVDPACCDNPFSPPPPQATSDPIEFNFGPFIVREWITRGPDGIVLAAIERVQPALEGWPQLRKLSRAFNATHIVPDIEAAAERLSKRLRRHKQRLRDHHKEDPGEQEILPAQQYILSGEDDEDGEWIRPCAAA